jgi:hypothetical protein
MFRMQASKLIRMSSVVLILCVCALAQTYPMPPPSPGGGTYMPHSYGHGAAIGAAVGAGAGATALYFGLRHRHHQVVGCVSPDGKNLATDDGKHTYQLAGTEQVNAGEHVSVVGKTKSDSGVDELEIQSVKQHFGQCEQHAALIEELP